MADGIAMVNASVLNEDSAASLARRCALHLEQKGMPPAVTIDKVVLKSIQPLWTGMGGVDEVCVSYQCGEHVALIVKHVGTPEQLSGHEEKRDHHSYSVEASFFQHGHADGICNLGALCPRPILVDREELGVLKICMSKLPGTIMDRSDRGQICAVLVWLARLHARYWGNERADEAVQSGLQQQGCYWHLDTRHLELGRMSDRGIDGRLRLAAAGLDARLKADTLQTICHGDAKAANIMFSSAHGVSLFDFQWVGKAPPSKDLAYFMACGASLPPGSDEEELLHVYHTELNAMLIAQSDEPPAFEQLWISYVLACSDLARWMAGWGWWGNALLLRDQATAVLDLIDHGEVLASEAEYTERIFAAFPPEGHGPSTAQATVMASPAGRRIVKEGERRGLEIEHAAEMGGLQFFCTFVDEPHGDIDMLIESVRAMNRTPVDGEKRKGCSEHVGKMVFSVGAEQVAVAVYVPVAKQDLLSCKEWMNCVLNIACGEAVSITGDVMTGRVLADKSHDMNPLEVRASMIAEGNHFLRRRGLFPESDEGDEEEDIIFGDDDFPP